MPKRIAFTVVEDEQFADAVVIFARLALTKVFVLLNLIRAHNNPCNTATPGPG